MPWLWKPPDFALPQWINPTFTSKTTSQIWRKAFLHQPAGSHSGSCLQLFAQFEKCDMRSFLRNRRGVLEMRDPQNHTMSRLKQSSIFLLDDNWFPMTLQTSTCRCPDHQEFLASSSNPGQSRPEMAGCGVSRPAHIMRHWKETCDRTHVFTRRFHSEFRSVMPCKHWIKGTYPLVN